MAGTTAAQKRAAIISVSASWLGVPYKWAGTSRNGVDCSGLTMNVYKAAAGISLPHYSLAQAALGKSVTAAQAQAGDLVFFGVPISHVGILLMPGVIRHAPHTGAVVRDESISTIGKPVVGYRNYLGDVGKDDSSGIATGPTAPAASAKGSTSSSSTRNVVSWGDVGGGLLHGAEGLIPGGAAADDAAGMFGHFLSSATGDIGDKVANGLIVSVTWLAALGLGVGLVLIGLGATAKKASGVDVVPIPA